MGKIKVDVINFDICLYLCDYQFMRLNAYIAGQIGVSRRQADEMIQKGYVEIDGEIATFTDQVGPASTLRIYKNQAWVVVTTTKDKNKAILFYKPIFTVVTHKDPQRRKTIYDILPKQYHNLKFAGRLDYLSEGLMVLTNNGELIHELTHPSMGKTKAYLVVLKYTLRKEQIQEMEDGLEIRDENARFEPISISRTSLGAEIPEKLPRYDDRNLDFLKIHKEHFAYVFYLNEGQNNQIRKMCTYYGQDVLKLVRLEMGNYKISYDLYRRKVIEL
jgi:23S rRNA pseudouridine2605 synthase